MQRVEPPEEIIRLVKWLDLQQQMMMMRREKTKPGSLESFFWWFIQLGPILAIGFVQYFPAILPILILIIFLIWILINGIPR